MMMVNNPSIILIRPSFFGGGWHWGGPLDPHDSSDPWWKKNLGRILDTPIWKKTWTLFLSNRFEKEWRRLQLKQISCRLVKVWLQRSNFQSIRKNSTLADWHFEDNTQHVRWVFQRLSSPWGGFGKGWLQGESNVKRVTWFGHEDP